MRKMLPLLDNLEMLQVEDSVHEFPLHYHDCFCLSIIDKGMFGENELIAPAGTILISHPNELHSNSVVNNTAYNMLTYYVHEDVMKFKQNASHISFDNRVIDDPYLFNHFKRLSNLTHGNENDYSDLEEGMLSGLEELVIKHAIPKPFSLISGHSSVEEVKNYISKHIDKKIKLEELARIVGMDRYKFTRWFKKNVGLTPFEYIIVNRIELAKKMILNGDLLTHVALSTGFYDQSNFSNYFKRFVGITPKGYQNGYNIS